MVNRIRKIVMALCAVMIVMGGALSAEAALTISQSGVNSPSGIKTGDTFSIKGTVTADGIIKKAVVTIYNSTGKKCLQRYEATPNSTIFNVASADNSIAFDTLKKGTYYYRICVYDTNRKKYRIVNNKFVVSDTGKAVVTKEKVNVPTELETGKSFKISGKINATFLMSKIVVSIYKSNGKTSIQRYETKVNSYSYNINKAAAHLKFEKVKAGTYYYRIAIFNTKGKKTSVVNSKFTVVNSSKITITGAVPSSDVTITKGTSYGIEGTISSTYKLTNVTGKVLDLSGNVVYGKSVNPNSKTFVLKNSAIDSALFFEKLPVGTYTYQVLAKDSGGKVVKLVDRKIYVTGTVTSSSGTKGEIQLVFASPEGDITLDYGSVCYLGGVVVSRYVMSNITLTLRSQSGTLIASKSVDPGSRVYMLDNGVLDAAIEFETLKKGNYNLQLTAKDKIGTTVTLMTRKVKIK